MYRAIRQSGFRFRKALEPSVGSGNFVGMQPNASWTTVDIDATNDAVVSKLYPKAKHYNISFELFKEEGYDLIISNVPFSEERGRGRLKNRPEIKALHDFYFAHALTLVKDNGVIAFITSTGTMDKTDESIRREVIAKADVLGAYRLPQGHFWENAHTEVTTDVIFLMKRPEGAVPTPDQQAINEAWAASSKTADGIYQNEYYQSYPHHILGAQTVGKDKLHGGRPAYVVTGEARLDEIGFTYKPYETKRATADATETQKAPDNSKEFYAWAAENYIRFREQSDPLYQEHIQIEAGRVYVASEEVRFRDIDGKVMVFTEQTGDEVQKVVLLDEILAKAEAFQKGDEDAGAEGIDLILQYRQAYRKHPNADNKLKRFFKEHDEESYLYELAALFDANWTPADVFTTRTRYEGSGKIEARGTLKEQAFANEDSKGVIRIAQARGLQESDVLELLGQGYALVERGPAGSTLQNDILYYAGNIYQKIDGARAIEAPAEYQPAIQSQIERLDAVKPTPKALDEIRFKGTEAWILPFTQRLTTWQRTTTKEGMREWDTGDKILDNYLNSQKLITRRTDEHGVPLESLGEFMERVRLAEEHVEDKLDELRQKITRNPDLLKRVEESYNRRFRNYVKPDYEKAQYLVQDVLDEIEKNSPIRLRKNQIEWLVQAVYEGKGINAHDVGGGKTFASIALARVLKKRGAAKKPMFVVPAKTIKKWKRDILTLFPDAKIIDLGALSADKRTKALHDLSNTNADYVLVSTEGFTNIKLPADVESRYIDDVLNEHVDDPGVKGRARATLRERVDRLKAILEEEKRDTRLTFDKLGIDMIVADEAHAYKNIGIRNKLVKFGLGKGFGVNTGRRETGRVDSQGEPITEETVSLMSARAYDFRFKSNYVLEHNNNRNIFLLTATPTPNKPMEIYTMIRHLSRDIFHEYGILSDQDFSDTFFKLGSVKDQARNRDRQILKAIVNAQELRGILNRYVDKIPMEQMPWITIPRENVIEHVFERPDAYQAIADDLDQRRKNLPRHPTTGDDTLVGLYTAGRAASVDPRLYGGEHAAPAAMTDVRSYDAEDDKIQFSLDNIVKVHQENPNAGQLLFLDAAGHQQVERGHLTEDLHSEIKNDLIKQGFKATEIAIINGNVVTNPRTGRESASGDRDAKKQEIADAYNEGRIKVVIGTTSSMGEGMDLQIKTTDIYHVDIPYTPGAFRQRNGRAIRYGNENDQVNVHYMLMKGTFDALSFGIVSHKKGWNQALWEKEVAEEISTEEEMAEGAIPRQEQILIELERDPVRKQYLILSFQYQRLQEERNELFQMQRTIRDRLNRARVLLAERQEILKGQQKRLGELKPKETIKDEAERQATFEKQKKVLENSIEISEDKLKEVREQIAKFEARQKDLTAQEQTAEAQLQDFRRQHVDDRGEIVVASGGGPAMQRFEIAAPPSETLGQEKDRYRRVFRKAPRIRGSRLRMVDVADAVDPETLAEWAADPLYTDLAHKVHRAFRRIVDKIGAKLPDRKLRFFGFMFSRNVAGLHVLGSYVGARNSQILMNVPGLWCSSDLSAEDYPERMAGQMVATMMHEITHQSTREHTEKYAGLLTRFNGMTILEQARATRAIAAVLRKVGYEELDRKFNRQYSQSVRADLLRQIGSRQEIAEPGEPGRKGVAGPGQETGPGRREGGERPEQAGGEVSPGTPGPAHAVPGARGSGQYNEIDIGRIKTTPTSQGPAGKPVAPREIVDFIRQKFKLPVRGKATHRTKVRAGWFDPRAVGVRMVDQQAIGTAVHEMGHYVDWHLEKRWSAKPPSSAIRQELLALGKALYGQKQPPGGYKSEGWAEFLRIYLTDDDAQTKAPALYKFFTETFLPGRPKMAANIAAVRQMVDAYRQQGAEARIEAQISRKEDKGPLGERLRKRWRKAVGNWVDELDALWQLGKAAEEQLGRKLEPAEHPGELARAFASKAPAKAREFVLTGTTDLAGNKKGGSLKDALSGIDRKDMAAFTRWIYAKEALYRWSQGKNPGISQADAQHVYDRGAQNAAWQKAADAVTQWNNDLLDYLVEAGALDSSLRDTLQKAPVYIPLMRAFNEGELRAPGVGTGRGPVQGGKAIRRMHGSGRQIQDPFDSMIQQAERFFTIAHKAVVAKSLYDIGTKVPGMAGVLWKVPAPMQKVEFEAERIRKDIQRVVVKHLGVDPDLMDREGPWDDPITLWLNDIDYRGKDNIVGLTIGAKKEWFEVDSDLYRAIQGLDVYSLPGFWRLFAIPTRALRMGATALNPAFGLVRNFIRDGLTGLVTGEHARLGPISSAKGVVKDIAGSESARRFKALGGKMASQLLNDRIATQRLRDELTGNWAIKTAKHPIEALRELFGISEQGFRIEEFEKAYQEGSKRYGAGTLSASIYALNAAQQSTVNFTRHGRIAKILNEIIPFFNAAIQGPVVIFEVARRNPKRFFTTSLVGLTLPAVALWALAQRDEDDEDWYGKLSDFEKASYLHFRVPGTQKIVRIPIPFELGYVFQALPVAVLDQLWREDPAQVKDIVEIAARQIQPFDWPAFAGPAVEAILTNKDFRGIPIETEAMKNMLPGDRVRPYTTKLMRYIGAKTNLSPVVLEHLVDGYSGGMYRRLARTADLATGKAQAAEAADIPVVGTLFVRQSERPNEGLDKFYERLDLLNQKAGSKKATGAELAERHEYNVMTRQLAKLRKKTQAEGASKDERKRVFAEMDAITRRARKLTQEGASPKDILSLIAENTYAGNNKPHKGQEDLVKTLIEQYKQQKGHRPSPADLNRARRRATQKK